MALVRSLLFALAFYPGTAGAVLLAFPAAVLGHAPVRWVTHGWARWHRWCAWFLLGVRSKVEGKAPDGVLLFAAKHQSMFETIEILLLLDRPTVVMKRQIADIPLFGWVARRYGVIPVDREGGAAALRTMLRAARMSVEHARPIVIFPEGTRVLPGDQPPLQPGFAGLYRALGLPVVPIALDSGLIWPRGRFVKQAGVVTVRFGETIPPGLARPEIEAEVHRAINVLDV